MADLELLATRDDDRAHTERSAFRNESWRTRGPLAGVRRRSACTSVGGVLQGRQTCTEQTRIILDEATNGADRLCLGVCIMAEPSDI